MRAFLPHERFGRAVSVLVVGGVGAQLVTLCSAPLMTRLYSPSDFGIQSALSSIVGVAVLVSSLRYELAIPIQRTDRDALVVLSLSVVLLAGCCALLLPPTVAVPATIANTLRCPSLGSWLWFVPLTVLGAGLYQNLNYWALRKHQYGVIARTRFTQACWGVVVMLAVGVVVDGPLGLLLGALASQTAGVARLGRDPWKTRRTIQFQCALQELVDTAVRHRGLPMYGAAASVLNSVGIILPPLLFTMFYGERVAGLYSLAFRVLLVPMSVIGVAVGQAFLGHASEAVRNQSQNLRPLMRRVILRMLPLAIAVLVVGMVAPYVFPFVFGKKWYLSGDYARWLCLVAAIQVMVSPLSNIAVAREKMGSQLMLDALRAVVVIVGLWGCELLGLGAIHAVMTFSFGMCAVYVVSWLVYYRLAGGAAAVPAGTQPPSEAAIEDAVERFIRTGPEN